MAEDSLDSLKARHEELDKQIQLEANRRVPDETRLAAMKKEKLALKDQLDGIAAQ